MESDLKKHLFFVQKLIGNDRDLAINYQDLDSKN